MKMLGLRRIASIVFYAILAGGALASDCSYYSTQIATTPIPPQIPESLGQSIGLLSRIPNRQDLVFVGDSLLSGWSEDVPASPGLFFNFSVGNDKTQNVLWRLAHKNVSQLAPKRVVILVGTNNFNDPGMEPCGIAAGIKRVVIDVEMMWPAAKLFVVGILPRGPDFQLFNAARKEINDDIREATYGRDNVKFVQVDEEKLTCGGIKSRPLPSMAMICAPSDVFRCENYKNDNLHLSSGGYRILMEALLREGL